MSARAWNGWYHVDGHTYGTWLPGDPRGWRTRRHREHVEGDYRNLPPPGRDAARFEQSKSLMRSAPVFLTRLQRRLAVEAFVEKFAQMRSQVIAISVDRVHYHILGKFPDGDVREPVGRAKKNASHALTSAGLPGTVWARKCRALPIKDRGHQVNTFTYIRDHKDKGACVWTFRDGFIDRRIQF